MQCYITGGLRIPATLQLVSSTHYERAPDPVPISIRVADRHRRVDKLLLLDQE